MAGVACTDDESRLGTAGVVGMPSQHVKLFGWHPRNVSTSGIIHKTKNRWFAYQPKQLMCEFIGHTS